MIELKKLNCILPGEVAYWFFENLKILPNLPPKAAT